MRENEHADDAPMWPWHAHDAHESAAWPLITIAGLCLVPIVIASVGAWFFGWRAVALGALIYLFGNVTWALVQHLVRTGKGIGE